MKRLIVTFAAFSFVFLAAGCGQSGPLYLPGNPSRMEAAPPAPAETAAETAAETETEEETAEESDDDKE